MKSLVKFMSLTIIGFIVCVCLIYLVNLNIMINEMNNASKIAVETCQDMLRFIKIDDYYDIESSSYPIYDDESYKNYFISSFYNLVSDKDIYDLDVYCDYSKGLLGVYIHNNYSSFIKDKKLINIIEVDE